MLPPPLADCRRIVPSTFPCCHRYVLRDVVSLVLIMPRVTGADYPQGIPSVRQEKDGSIMAKGAYPPLRRSRRRAYTG